MHLNSLLKRLVTTAALGLLTTALGPGTALAQITMTEAEGDRARELLLEGIAAIDAGNFKKALPLLKEAFGLMQSYDIAAALGQAELELGEFPEAATHLRFALNQFPPSESRTLKQAIAEGFSKAMEHVGVLRLTVTPADAEVFINGELQGRASELPPELFVAPGQLEILAQIPNGRATHSLVANAGLAYSITLAAKPEPATDPEATPTEGNSLQESPSTTAPQSDASKSWVPVIVGGVVTAVAAGTGIYLSVAASNDRDEMRELQDAHGESGCAGGGAASPACETQADAVRGADRKANFAVVSYTVAGVGLVATVGYWLWARPDTNGEAAQTGSSRMPRVDGALGSDRAILTLSGRF